MTLKRYNLTFTAMQASFVGAMDVDITTNIVQAVYETINELLGSDNLLISPNLQVPFGYNNDKITSFDLDPDASQFGFEIFKPQPYVTAYFDNGFMPGWRQFDGAGILLYGLSQFADSYLNVFQRIDDPTKIDDCKIVISSNGATATSIDATIYISDFSLISNVCFPKDTMVLCDQGWVKIQELKSANTFGGFGLVAVTETVSQDDHLIEFKAACFGLGSPSRALRMSKDHAVLKDGKLLKASRLSEGVKVPYNGEILYNVLLEVHGLMNVQGVACETLHPENSVAKYYMANTKQPIQEWNDAVLKKAVYA